jgi:hypothetical protein
VQREITSMYGIPFVDKQHGFRIHYPSGWKFHTSRKTSRAVHCEYRGRLSHAPDEKEVLLAYDVTAEPCNDTLAAYSARFRRELAKALGRCRRDLDRRRARRREPRSPRPPSTAMRLVSTRSSFSRAASASATAS